MGRRVLYIILGFVTIQTTGQPRPTTRKKPVSGLFSSSIQMVEVRGVEPLMAD